MWIGGGKVVEILWITAKNVWITRKKKKIKKRLKKVLTFQNRNDILNKSLGGDGKQEALKALQNKA